VVDSHSPSSIQTRAGSVKGFSQSGFGEEQAGGCFERWRASALDLASGNKTEGFQALRFPCPKSPQALLVGCRQLSKNSRDLWRLVSEWVASEPPPVVDDFLPDVQAELSYDMPRALDRILANFVRPVNPQGAWLAIRRVISWISSRNGTTPIGTSFRSPLIRIPCSAI